MEGAPRVVSRATQYRAPFRARYWVGALRAFDGCRRGGDPWTRRGPGNQMPAIIGSERGTGPPLDFYGTANARCGGWVCSRPFGIVIFRERSWSGRPHEQCPLKRTHTCDGGFDKNRVSEGVGRLSAVILQFDAFGIAFTARRRFSTRGRVQIHTRHIHIFKLSVLVIRHNLKNETCKETECKFSYTQLTSHRSTDKEL